MVGVAGEFAAELELLLKKRKLKAVKKKDNFPEKEWKMKNWHLVGPGGRAAPGHPGKTPGERSEKCWKEKRLEMGSNQLKVIFFTWRRFVAAVLLRALSGWRTGDNPDQDGHHGDGGEDDRYRQDDQDDHYAVVDRLWGDDLDDDDLLLHLDRVSWEDLWGEEAGPHRGSSPLGPELKKITFDATFLHFNVISFLSSQLDSFF